MVKVTPSLPLVFVVILNRNGRGLIEDCLLTLKKSDYPRLRICMVDNQSEDDSPDWVAAQHPDVHLIRNPENMGWSAANNIGIRQGLKDRADFIWLLNNDVEVDPVCVGNLIRFADAHPRVGVLSPLIYFYTPRDRIWFAGGTVSPESGETDHCQQLERFRALPQTRRFISGCAMFVRSAVFRRIGLIDELFVHYFEDSDFSLRAARCGYELDVAESAVIYHKVSQYFNKNTQTHAHQVYHSLRSSLFFWRRQLGWWAFHRQYCHGHLAKWVNQLKEEWSVEETRPRAKAVVDALWCYVANCRGWRRVPAPEWFRRFVLRRPWLLAELMAFRFGGLLGGLTGKRRMNSI